MIIKVTDNKIELLREGDIKFEEIKEKTRYRYYFMNKLILGIYLLNFSMSILPFLPFLLIYF